MKIINLIAITLITFFLTSCGTPSKPIYTETPTSSPTSLPTPTPSLTPTPTFTNTTTATPDLTILGKPEKPFAARWNQPTYTENDFDVIQKSIHGRTITIAWEKIANIGETKRNEISNFYFQSFIEYWDIFQGFPYDSYTVVLKKKGNKQGETGIGYEATAREYAHVLDFGLKEMISHEVFHAWVGNAICGKDERKLDDGSWFFEGITQYYGDRGAGITEFKILMNEHFQVYTNEIKGTVYDIPLVDMPAKSEEVGEAPSGMNRTYRLNVYWKGALVAYLMDERLIESGLTLDDFLKYLYEKYALKQTCITTKNAIQALNDISGENWTDFFNAYLYGNEELPLKGTFEYFEH